MPERKNVLAAFTSRSWVTPHSQVHSLIPSPALPFGLLRREPQHEQVWVVYDSLISSKTIPAWALLYSNSVFNVDQPASKTDLAILVLTSFWLLTLPMNIAAFSLTSLRCIMQASTLRFLSLHGSLLRAFCSLHAAQYLNLPLARGIHGLFSLQPLLSVAVFFTTQINTHTGFACTCSASTSTTTLKYHRPLESSLNDPDLNVYWDNP